jgi:hypothetical protein
MALEIKFEGYVNEIKQFSWGTVVKMSHSQRAKNEATGEWETVGKDYLDVTLPEGAVAPEEDSIARVTGTFKTSTYEKRDGSTGIAIKVRAQSIEPVIRDAVAAVRQVMAPAGDVW